MRILSRIEKASSHGFIRPDIESKLVEPFKQELISAENTLKEMHLRDRGTLESILHRVLTLHALEIERNALFELFSHTEIDERLFRMMLSKIESQIARIEDGKTQIKDAFERKHEVDRLIRFFSWCEDILSPNDALQWQYMKVRTRQILTEKVLRQLHVLEWVAVLSDTEALRCVRELYEGFHDRASEARKNLLLEHRSSLLEGKLVESMVHKYTHEALHDMENAGLITHKSSTLLKERLTDKH